LASVSVFKRIIEVFRMNRKLSGRIAVTASFFLMLVHTPNGRASAPGCNPPADAGGGCSHNGTCSSSHQAVPLRKFKDVDHMARSIGRQRREAASRIRDEAPAATSRS